jgi:3-hydroxybutyrate dehydrogenase
MADRYLTNRVAMVTGGASGMGRAMALAMAEKGADVIIGSLLAAETGDTADGEVVHRPGEAELQQTRKEIEAFGVTAHACELDVCQPTSCEDFYKRAIQSFGRVDILANAAGITAEQTISGHSEPLWLKVMDVNANGPFRMTRLVLPAMIEQGWGRIINIASTAASVGAVTSGAYCASKAAVVGMTRCVAQEGAPHGVTCNAISPGPLTLLLIRSIHNYCCSFQSANRSRTYCSHGILSWRPPQCIHGIPRGCHPVAGTGSERICRPCWILSRLQLAEEKR